MLFKLLYDRFVLLIFNIIPQYKLLLIQSVMNTLLTTNRDSPLNIRLQEYPGGPSSGERKKSSVKRYLFSEGKKKSTNNWVQEYPRHVTSMSTSCSSSWWDLSLSSASISV